MKIIICGDSTAAAYDPKETPMVGWGQRLGLYVQGAEIRNHAMAGRSTRTFIAEGRLERASEDLAPGDLMLIQFGHNDENTEKPERYADPEKAFPENLEIFVRTARKKGAHPVLMTPICIRNWQEGKHLPSHGVYPQVVRDTADRLGVPLIDLYADSLRLVEEAGEKGSRKLFMNFLPGEESREPQGRTDNAHTRLAGADAFARAVAEHLRERRLL
jgi:lysophospholipase L1-like esterase